MLGLVTVVSVDGRRVVVAFGSDSVLRRSPMHDRFGPQERTWPDHPAMSQSAMSGRKQVQQCWCRRANLFDHVVGAGEKRRRDGEAEYPGGLRVDDQLELARLHYRQVCRFCTFEDAADVDSRLTKPVRDVGSIAH